MLANFTFAFILDTYSVQNKLQAARSSVVRVVVGGHGHGSSHGGDAGGAGGPLPWWAQAVVAYRQGRLNRKLCLGLLDWRATFVDSGVSFAGWRVTKAPHHNDAEEELHVAMLTALFPQLLGRAGRARGAGGSPLK